MELNDANPLVSIIILNYNAGKLLEECVDSIYQSNYNNFEIILVDNNSNLKHINFLNLSSVISHDINKNCYPIKYSGVKELIYIENNFRFLSLKSFFPSLQKEQVCHLDLSVSSPWLGNPTEFNDLDWFDYELNKIQKGNPKKIISGGYLEPHIEDAGGDSSKLSKQEIIEKTPKK